MEAQPKLCEHVHLPVQSGSTKVLRAMQRTYTRDEYLGKIAMIRSARRPIAITTDIIAGVPDDSGATTRPTLATTHIDQTPAHSATPPSVAPGATTHTDAKH